MTFLLEQNGMDACQVGPAKSLKAIAAFVSDRDNGVRLAGLCRIVLVSSTHCREALNAIVAVYDIIGDDVHKLIGPLPPKDEE
jgi:hypothetical protein